MTNIIADLSNKDRALIYALLAGQEQIMGMLQDLTDQLTQQKEQIMAQFDDVEAELQKETDAGKQMALALATIHQELVDILASGATPQRIQALADKLKANEDAWVAAVQANPDPAPGPTPTP